MHHNWEKKMEMALFRKAEEVRTRDLDIQNLHTIKTIQEEFNTTEWNEKLQTALTRRLHHDEDHHEHITPTIEPMIHTPELTRITCHNADSVDTHHENDEEVNIF